MQDILAQLPLLRPLVMQAPESFVIVAFALLGLGWALGRFMYSQRIENLKSRLERWEEENAALKDQVKTLPSADPGADRKEMLRKLTQYYVSSTPDADPQIAAGLALPPMGWINDELSKRDQKWRVRGVTGTNYEIVNVAVWG